MWGSAATEPPGGGFGRGVPPPAENFAILGTENHVLMHFRTTFWGYNVDYLLCLVTLQLKMMNFFFFFFWFFLIFFDFFFFFFLRMSKSAEIRGSAEKSHAWEKYKESFLIVSSWNRDLMLMLERPLSHYWTSLLRAGIPRRESTCSTKHFFRVNSCIRDTINILSQKLGTWEIICCNVSLDPGVIDGYNVLPFATWLYWRVSARLQPG